MSRIGHAAASAGLKSRFVIPVFAAIVIAFAALIGLGTNAAEAKPTGWQSESELKAQGSNAWGGYGDSGYSGQPKKPKRVEKAKAKKLKSSPLGTYAKSYGSKTGKQAAKKKASGKKYAAIDTKTLTDVSPPSKSLTGGGVRWVASSSCLNGTLVSLVGQVASKYGSVTVSSTCRGKKHNASVGGAKKSHHLTGNAVDFRVHGNWRGAVAFLRGHGSLGGVKHYGGGLFHADTGPKRRW